MMDLSASIPSERSMRVVVIGGAGFIGSHLVDALVGGGFHVRVVDNLDPQVHRDGQPPAYLNPRAEFVQQDVRDRDGLQKTLEGAEAVFHLAGAVGVGDSMYRIRHYAETNVLGGANLLDILANRKNSVRKIVLASSVTVYGEGKYLCPLHGVVFPSVRVMKTGVNRRWDLHCPIQTNAARCREKLSALPTDEEKPATPQSIYAITKRTQEELFLASGRAYGVPVVVLRYFNVYGSRQALSNPYTGVAKIFALHFAQGKVPLIYEDGRQTRDFIHVSDVVRANILALTRDEAAGEIFNVGTGHPTSILEMARAVAKKFGNRAVPKPSNQFRAGDVRHCWADSTKIRSMLGFESQRIFPSGLEDVVTMEEAVRGPAQTAVEHQDLVQRGLIS
jgi:dTDP-L-rhamnose 4-epimerase